MGFDLEQYFVDELVVCALLLELLELAVDLLSFWAAEGVVLFGRNVVVVLDLLLLDLLRALGLLEGVGDLVHVFLHLLVLGGCLLARHLFIINTMGFQELKYMLTAFRTKKAYLIFQVCQLLLSVTIIVVALTSKAHFKTPTVLILELVLFLTLAFDLLVVRWISEGGLCHRRINIFDLGLLCLFAATLCFLAVYAESPNEEKDYRELVETDDIIILVIVIARYIAQAVSLILTIRNSSANRQIHKEIKNVNLNNIELNLSANFGEAYKAEERVREKMTAKKNALVEQL